MRRREFSTLLGGAATASTIWPFAANAQQKPTPVIGYLAGGTPTPLGLLYKGLSETGYLVGQNLAVEHRWAGGRFDRLPDLAADLVGRQVDVIVAVPDPAAYAAKNATSTIPIVFLAGGDPVGGGLVASLARPGGNLTGVSFLTAELDLKRFELLSELVPQAKVIALLVNPNIPRNERVMGQVHEVAQAKGVQLLVLKAGTESDINAAFAALVQGQAGALVVFGDSFFYSRRDQIVALASYLSIPAIYELSQFATAGGLVSYGTSLTAINRQIGTYVGKILRGAKPADLPVVQPTKFDLVINLKTAKALGLTIPPAILARAGEIIE
jgi:putative tryptophan/tyrosine transport system substrate-binding protein